MTEEQKAELKRTMPNRISMTPTVGKSSTKPSLDELLESGNFFIKKEGLTKAQIDLVLKCTYNLKANKK